MAFDQATRNRLSKFVSDTRKLLSDEFAQQMRVKYGLDPATGVVTDIDKLPTMAEGDRQTAQMLRDTLEHYLATAPKRDKKTVATTIDRIVREQAFTVLNRLCAVRMAESRELVIESIAQGTKSKGFQLYARLAGSALGETGEAYVSYLFCLFDELSIDLPVLFDRFSPSGRLFPRESVLIDVLGQINHHELQHLWAEDETIGWIYQYFNSDEERKAMRDVKAGGSAAPRNSRELAVRNQFFTPRYVVEFLTDNTLGRIWYEMTQGQTLLVDNCKYLVRRSDEVFLSHMTSKDQEHPSEGTIAMAELLLSGTEETFPEFKADDPQPMIDLAHCVSAYATMGDRAHEMLGNRTLMVRERSVHEPSEIVDAVEAAPYVLAGQLKAVKTQHMLEVLFMTCRSDRHGGDGSVYSESWFVDACNEVRRRVIDSRRDDLSQEELLRPPVFIPYRPMKDPRDIKMLDPACGSMHFGLYAFDLLLTIYEEAWELEERLSDQAFVRPRAQKSLQDSYGTRERYILDVPRLIIERNIHGIDIDARAVQIAGLSLWLRAQKAWHEAGVKPADRPQITRSNIVCAEPMPGESELLEQFISDHLSQTSEQQTVASIVRRVFDAMKLAGDAGSLLKIEEEIADTIAEAKKKWVEGPKALQLPLFAIDAKQKDARARSLLVAGIDDASFWDEIEERIYDSLSKYGETADAGYQRRLFSDDTARGFAFIDLCRKRYDVALMNPPFGDPPRSIVGMLDEGYSDGKWDLASAFVARSTQLCTTNGFVGAISTRIPLFTISFEGWRRSHFIDNGALTLMVDLGGGVLDAAMVETAAYCIAVGCEKAQTIFIPVYSAQKAEDAIMNPEKWVIDCVKSFEVIPGFPLAYWLPREFLHLFAKFESFEPSFGCVSQGLGTTDDFRFCRLRFEVPATTTGIYSKANIESNKRWVPYVKGENFSPYYDDYPLLVNWKSDGLEVKEFNRQRYGSASRNVKSEDSYGRSGLVFPRRTRRFVPRYYPEGMIFSVGGQSMLCDSNELMLLGYAGTSIAATLVRSMLGRVDIDPQFEVGVIKRLPIPELVTTGTQIEQDVLYALSLVGKSLQFDETNILFQCPLHSFGLKSIKESAENLRAFLSLHMSSLRETHQNIENCVSSEIGLSQSAIAYASNNFDLEREELWKCSDVTVASRIISYTIGALLGRWDVRYATGELKAPELPDPLKPLPICSPGALCNDAGLPLGSDAGLQIRELGHYPIDVAWDGYLVDDSEHPLDIERCVQTVLGTLWGSGSDVIEQEACDLLSTSSLRDYFRKPAGFFADHLSRYSKSRRQAPIYWPLSIESGEYTLWIYFHRISHQTLYTAINDLLEPKLKDLREQIKELRANDSRDKDDEAEFERLCNLESELDDFCSELIRIGGFWKPNLNDGVQITAAPLWKFFRLKKWRETLKKTWEELEQGKYDWAHLALSIWPERVVRTAHKDRSIAIAHDLEELLWHEVQIKRSSKTGRVTTKIEWQPRELSEKELDAIVAKVKSGEIGSNNAASAEVANG